MKTTRKPSSMPPLSSCSPGSGRRESYRSTIRPATGIISTASTANASSSAVTAPGLSSAETRIVSATRATASPAYDTVRPARTSRMSGKDHSERRDS